MQNTQPQTPLGQLWNSIQSWLFPMLEDEIGALDEKHRQFVAVCELYRRRHPSPNAANAAAAARMIPRLRHRTPPGCNGNSNVI